jgi:iron complex outermembrane receptor protein
MNNYRLNRLLLCAFASIFGPYVLVAHADTEVPASEPAKGQSELGEIIVTAQKREQKLSDVGMAITAVRGDDLVRRGFTSVGDLAKLEPSLQFAQGNTGTPTYTIRGVGYFDQSLAASPTVSVYQDEVAYTYPSLTKGAFLDVERVEILKGPQGTLYGQNATGGAINFVAAKPTNTFAAGFDESYGRFNDNLLSGFVSGPITPTLSARLAASLEEGGAWQKSNTRDDTLGNKDIKIGRLLLDWHPNDSFRANLNLNGWTDDSQRQANQLEGFRFLDPQYISPVGNSLSDPKSFLPNPAYSAIYPARIQTLLANPISPRNDQAADWIAGTHPRNHESFYQGALRLEYSISDSLGVTSLTNFEKYSEDDRHDDAGVNQNSTGGSLIGTVKTISEELRLHGVGDDGKLNWMIGGNYNSDKSAENQIFDQYFASASYLTGGTPFSVLPSPPFQPFVGYTANSSVDARTSSVFGNLEYHILDNWSVHGGVRYTRSDQNFTGCATIPDPNFDVFIEGLESLLQGGAKVPAVQPGDCTVFLKDNTLGRVYTSLNQSNVPWRIGTDWKITPEDLIYFSVSKGFKQGASPTLGGESYIQFKPVVQEQLLSYEIGFKSAMFDRTLQVDGAVFHYDYKNKQVLGRIIDPTGVFGAIQALVNIPKSAEDGAELSAAWRPIAGLTVNAAATYLDSRVTSSFLNYASYATGAADQVNFQGESFPFTPKWSLSYGARYEWGLSDKLSAFLSADSTYQTKTVAAFGAAHADAEGPSLDIKAYGLLNLTAGVESLDQRWRVELWGKNVTNKYYWTSAFYVNDTTVRVTGLPTTYGIAVHYRY